MGNGCVHPQDPDELLVEEDEWEVDVDAASEGYVLAEFHMYDHGYVTIGDPPWEETPFESPATWPPALNYPAWRWWPSAHPVTL